MSVLVDTNVALYMLGGDTVAAPVLVEQSLHLSFVTEMEGLGFLGPTETEEAAVRAFLGNAVIVGLNDDIKRETIRIRRAARLKLLDAIIAATGFVERLPLVTADRDFLRVERLPLVLYDP